MDFRPLGDGMSCVAVAMPRAVLGEGTTEAAPGLRRIYAVVGKLNRGRSRDGLPITPDDEVGEAERRVTNQKERRGAKREGGGKEGRDEAYQSRPAAGKRLNVRRAEGVVVCFNTATLPRWRLSAQAGGRRRQSCT